MNLTDLELAEKITAYRADHPHANRKQIRMAVGTGLERMERLESAGMVVLPHKLPKSAGARLGGIKSGWGKFRIKP